MAIQKPDISEFKVQQDTSVWRFTDWIQVGRSRWQRQSEKFWRVPAAIKDDRYALCQQCEHFVAATNQCQKCLCFMGIKTWLGGFACPIGKWPAEQDPDSR